MDTLQYHFCETNHFKCRFNYIPYSCHCLSKPTLGFSSLETALVQASWDEPQSNSSLKKKSHTHTHIHNQAVDMTFTSSTSAFCSYSHTHEVDRWRPTHSKQVKSANFNSGEGERRRGGVDDATMQPDELRSSRQFPDWNPQRPMEKPARVNKLTFLILLWAAADGCRSHRNSYPALTCRP